MASTWMPSTPPYSATSNTSERAPLMPQKRRPAFNGRWPSLVLCCLGAIGLVLFVGQNVGLVRCPLNDIPAAEKAKLRQQWNAERDEHRADAETWAHERAKYANETADWARERDAHKDELADWQREREEEARHRLELRRRSEGVYWTAPEGDAHCRSYGTRAYSAYLRDVPAELSWREVCYNMPPVVIQGRNFTQPDECERKDGDDIVGTWYADSGEANCVTSWGWFSDKGCTPSRPGFLRYEAPLENIRKGDDEQTMCATTPAIVRDVLYDSPSVCQMRTDWLGKSYMVGMWDVPDAARC